MHPVRAAVYARISDDREGAGLGVARQEKDCRQLAHSLGWDVVEVYVDNDLSAFQRRKPRTDYLRMLAAVEAGTVGGIIAWHNDRLHRNARELEDFIDLVERSGCHVQTVKAGRYDLTTPAGRLNARLVGNVAQYESETKRDRNLRKALELAEAGKVGNGGPRPFGYGPDRVTLVEAEAEILRELYARVIAGWPNRTIVRDLNDRGITTTTGGRWSVQGLKLNLLSWRNVGIRSHHGAPAGDAVWPAIVDRQTWETARAVLTSPDRPGAGRGPTPKYLLTGFLRCGLCGWRLRPVRTAKTQRFGCPAKTEGGCGSILIRYDPAEDFVVALLLARIEGEVDLTADAPPDLTDVLLGQIAAKEARLDALGEAYADDHSNPLELRAASAAINRQITDLRRQVAQEQHKPRPPSVHIRQEWPGLDLAQRRAALGTMVDRITVAPARVRGAPFDPSRLTVHWR